MSINSEDLRKWTLFSVHPVPPWRIVQYHLSGVFPRRSIAQTGAFRRRRKACEKNNHPENDSGSSTGICVIFRGLFFEHNTACPVVAIAKTEDWAKRAIYGWTLFKVQPKFIITNMLYLSPCQTICIGIFYDKIEPCFQKTIIVSDMCGIEWHPN